MTKAYVLDLRILKEQDVSVNELLTLIKLDDEELNFRIAKEDVKSLNEKFLVKSIIYNDEEITVIRKKGKLLVDAFVIDGLEDKTPKQAVAIKQKNEVVETVNELRLLWKGLKPGSMGSTEACIQKLTRWWNNYPQYTKEDILRSARIYLNSVMDYRYLQQTDYFIYKKDGKEEMSRLSSFIDEVEQNNTDWTSKLS